MGDGIPTLVNFLATTVQTVTPRSLIMIYNLCQIVVHSGLVTAGHRPQQRHWSGQR